MPITEEIEEMLAYLADFDAETYDDIQHVIDRQGYVTATILA